MPSRHAWQRRASSSRQGSRSCLQRRGCRRRWHEQRRRAPHTMPSPTAPQPRLESCRFQAQLVRPRATQTAIYCVCAVAACRRRGNWRLARARGDATSISSLVLPLKLPRPLAAYSAAEAAQTGAWPCLRRGVVRTQFGGLCRFSKLLSTPRPLPHTAGHRRASVWESRSFTSAGGLGWAVELHVIRSITGVRALPRLGRRTFSS